MTFTILLSQPGISCPGLFEPYFYDKKPQESQFLRLYIRKDGLWRIKKKHTRHNILQIELAPYLAAVFLNATVPTQYRVRETYHFPATDAAIPQP
jgi:hypothetical protein